MFLPKKLAYLVLKYCYTFSNIFQIILNKDARDYNRPKWYSLHRWDLWTSISIFWAIVFFFRCLAFTWALKTKQDDPQFYHTFFTSDLNCATLHRHFYRHTYAGLFSSTYSMIAIEINYLIGLKPNRHVWTLGYEVVMLNSFKFFCVNPKLAFKCDSFWHVPAEFVRFLSRIWNCKFAKFESRLPHLPNVSPRARSQTVAVTLALEAVLIIYQVISAIVITYGFLHYTYLLTLDHATPYWLLASLDAAIGLFTLWRNCVLLVFLFNYAIAICYLYGRHLVALNNRLKEAVIRAKMVHNDKSKISQAELALQLTYFMQEHSAILHTTVLANRRVVRTMALVLFLSTVITNIYKASALVFLTMKPLARLFFLVTVINQTSLGLMILGPLLRVTEILHGLSKLMFNLQACLGREYRRQKVKLLAYYEALHTRQKFYFTVGQLGSISKINVFEFITYYIGYMLYSFKIFIKNRANHEIGSS